MVVRLHLIIKKDAIANANKGVSWINYDQWGNPIRVQFTDHSITEHVYTADGRRLKTIHRTSVPQSNPLGIGVTASLTPAQTQSIDSVDYVGNFIYEKGQLKRYMFDDGYLKLYTNTFSPRFFIRDHLGNNRIVTDGSGNIQQNTNYYPYGGMTYISTNQGEQQFKYNGKEYDPMHGLNEYDYGARQYDPAIGKFTTMDPLCEKYYHISPYAYCAGNPVNAVDPDGRNPIYDTNGNFLGTDDNGLRGHYYMMDPEDFKQGMPHKDVVSKYSIKTIPSNIEARIRKHYKGLAKRPDYDGFVTIEEGIAWAQSHPNALKNPTPENTLYIDASKLDFGFLSTSHFSEQTKEQNLFNIANTIASLRNLTLRSTVYALGVVDIELTDRAKRTVCIVNNNKTDYDWNYGGNIIRNLAILLNNCIFNIDPQKHGFKTYYYGKGKLRK